MMKAFAFVVGMLLPAMVCASQPKGTITSYSFYGAGLNEALFLTMSPATSACPYAGKFIVYANDHKAMISGLIAAFHAGTTVQVFGTGTCDASWSNYEGVLSAEFSK